MQGQEINGFVLKKLLGEGGMAEVWYAENEIGKPAAVKILFEKLTRNEQIVERFHNEAVMMVKLKHPNIRQVYGYGYLNNRHCIVMEYLEGDDLSDMMKKGRRFTDAELRTWWNQIVSALNYTHAQGIVHRDIKPSNIFLDEDGNIKLLDFGIAKMMENSSLTQTGSLMGTLMYMSPEQVKDAKNIDYRTDIYSLAVSFVHLLTGKKPYNTDTTSDFEIRERIVYTPYDVSELPQEWQGFLAPYLEKEPDKRPALRLFEEVAPMAETTVVSGKPSNATATEAKRPQPQPQPQPVTDNATITSFSDAPKPDTKKPKKKSKVGLWIGIGVAALAVLVAAVLLVSRVMEKSKITEADNMAYQSCVTADDYRAYIRDYGSEGLHFTEANAEVEKLVADSTNKALQAIAEEQARLQAEAEARAKAEAEQKEDVIYENCNTIAGCDIYLEAYPEGRYVKEVEAKKAELKKAAEQAAAKKEAQKAEEKKKEAERAAKKNVQERQKENKKLQIGKKPNADKKPGTPKLKVGNK